ncbi:YciI family protein [Tenggerimyces flavus]|uniref:YciI family protein n=1 Tax=Tenggerimyces flavus TaxID=1708749 RepID=A0ABV7YBI4_9ACTN|nr:YciI family protein [Tenggerimyces flavus]MBM7785453.1 hypothetical protein [Tenggerimyces flavus]
MAQYAVLIYANDSAHSPDRAPGATASADRHAEELERTGAMVAAWALTPREMATSVKGDVITDGPFVDAKEIVAGFYILEAPDLDAALAIAKLNPACQQGGGVEVRPIDSGGVIDRKAG